MSNMLIFKHYFGPACSRPQLSFHIVVDYHKYYMFVLNIGDEMYAKPIWVARALSRANFATSHPHFKQFKWSNTNQQHKMKM